MQGIYRMINDILKLVVSNRRNVECIHVQQRLNKAIFLNYTNFLGHLSQMYTTFKFWSHERGLELDIGCGVNDGVR